MSEREDVEVLIDALDAGFAERWGTDPISGDDRRAVAEIIAPWLAAHDEAVRVSERVRLAGEVESVHHERGTTPESCDHCGHRWPCPTIRTLRTLVPVPGVRLTEEE